MKHLFLLRPPGAATRRGWLALLWLLCYGAVASAQTTTIGATAVPVVAPATSSYFYGPLYRSSATSVFNYSRYGHLYTAAELAIPTGAVITQLAWLKSDAGELTGNNVFNVLLANSSLTTLGTTQAWGTLSTGATSAYASTTQQVTGAAGTYFSVTLSQPFVYNGGNLLVLTDHEKQGTASAAVNFVTNPAAGFAVGFADSSPLTATTSLTAASYGDRRPTLRVTYAPSGPCTTPPTAGTTRASATSVCAGATVSLSLPGATFGTGLTYQWQESTNGTSFTDIAGATSATYTTGSLTATRSYQAKVTCSGQTATSTPVTVTVNLATYASLPVAESFEGTWVDGCATRDVPTNSWRNTPTLGDASWRRDDDGTSGSWTSPTIGVFTPAGSQGSTHSARFHSYYAGAGALGTLDLYVNLSASGNKVLQFDYLNTAGNDSLQVQVSTDGGSTFGAPLLRLGVSGTVAQGWQAQSVSLAATSATTVVRFRTKVTATFTSDIGLDNVRLAVLSGVPTCATNLVPAAAATNVARNATLSWQAGTGVTTGYDVYFGTTATPLLVSTNQAGTTYSPVGPLAATTTYYYQVVPRNANGPAVSCGVQSFTTNAVPTYCDPSTTNLGGICGSNNLTQITVGGSGLNATALTCSTVANGVGTATSAYTSYPAAGATTGTLLQGLSYPVTVNGNGNSIISVWVDYNQNGTFEATEWTQVATTTTANTAVTVNITVPANATLGQTGLRVRSRSNGSPNAGADACTTFGSGETKDFVVTIGAAPACAPPTALTATNIGTTSATLSYSAGGGTATNYVVQYGIGGFTPGGTGSTTVNTTNLTVPVTGLTANTSYQFYVTKSCGVGTTSQVAGPFTFTTQCLAPVYATLPVLESFENAWLDGCATHDIPTTSWRNTPVTGNNSWRREDDGPSAAWTLPNSYLYTPNASLGTHSARFHSGYSSAGLLGTLDLFVNLSAAGAKRLSFDFVNTTGSDSLVVQLSTDGGVTFSRLAGYNTSATFTTQVLPLSSTSATAVIRFRARADFGSTDIGLDNIVLESAAGCLTPANLATTATTATSAAVSWLASGSGTYSVLYGPTGFNPALPSSGTNAYTTVTGLAGSPYTITGLTASTAYQFYVIQNCGAGTNSALAGPAAFSTACITPVYATLPVLESFENTWLSRCATNDAPTNNWRNTPLTGDNSWRREDDGASANWVSPTAYAYTPTGSQGTHSARFHSGQASNGLIGTLDLFVNLSAAGAKRLSFDFLNTSGSDSLVVQLSNDGGLTFSRLAAYNLSGTTAAGFSTIVLPISSTSATAVIRFRGRADFGVTDIGLDNIVLESATGCLTPANLATTATTATSAAVSWLTGGSGTYSVLYGPTGFNPALPSSGTNAYTTVTGLAGPPYTITGLTASTAYQFYVQQNCGAGTNSGLAGPATFSTACITPVYATLPVTESFENTWLSRCDTREVPTNNWRNTPGTGDNSWRRDDDGTSAAWNGPTSGQYTPTASQGTHSARFHSYNAADGLIGTLDLFVNLSGAGAKRLSFDYLNTSGSDSLVVQLSNDGGTTFSRLTAYNLSGTAAAGFSNQVLTVNSTSATAVVRFRARSDYGFTDIGLDNIILESATGCLTPASLTATTTTTTAALSWLTGGTGTYTVQYGPTGFTPGSGTIVTGLTGPPYNVTGLTAGTTYQFYVTLNCGAGTNSGTAGPASFTTQILNDDPCGATTLAVNSTCTPLATTTVGATTTASTVYAASGQGAGCGSITAPRDVWFKFTTAATGPTSTQVRITVTGGAASVVRAYSGTACAGPLTYLTCSGTTSNTAAPLLDVVGLTPSTTYYVRVNEYSASGILGNFTICASPVPNCPVPAGLATGTLTSTTAVVNWATVPVAGSTFTVIYGPSGFTVPTGGTTLTGITTSSTTLTGLTPNTAYQFYVQQVCGGFNGSSTLAGPFPFTTPLAVPANNEPCGAVALGATVLNSTNVGATTSIQAGIVLPSNCSGAAQPKDVWFRFSPSGTSTTLTVTGSAAGLVRVFTSPDCAAGPFTAVTCVGSGTNNTGLTAPLVLTGLTPGQRYYVAVSGYGSSDTQDAFTIGATSLLATKAQANTDALVVFPNPSSTGQLTLRLSGLGGAGQATLLNTLGQVVLTKALSGNPEQTLATRGLATGVYTLRVTVAGQVLTRKVVLE